MHVHRFCILMPIIQSASNLFHIKNIGCISGDIHANISVVRGCTYAVLPGFVTHGILRNILCFKKCFVAESCVG